MKSLGDQSGTHSRVLLIYTGGTFGMVYDPKGNQLIPFELENALEKIPEIYRLGIDVTFFSLENPIDSSDITPEIWSFLATLIKKRYEEFDGFVILHGTDTMAYTASMLSFMLENLSKPVILTGAQLPIGVARSDARENLLTALEIAATKGTEENPRVNEVCIFFNSYLFRGNRAKKKDTSEFNAFYSDNYPALATAGVNIEYNEPFLAKCPSDLFEVKTEVVPQVGILKLFPGLSLQIVRICTQIPGLRGLVLETFGAGNAPTNKEFCKILEEAILGGLEIMNVTQCPGGKVMQDQYVSGRMMEQIGVISGSDITAEAGITKMMFVLGQTSDREETRKLLRNSLRGEMTPLS